MISVIMGAYRCRDTLERAIRSLRFPQDEAYEILCVEDCSEDGTWEALQRLSSEISALRIFRQPEHRGLAAALNAAVSEARGEWIARMDADDISHSDRFGQQLAFLREHAEFAFVGGAARLFDEGGRYGIRRFPAQPGTRDLVRGNPFIHPTLLFRAEALRRVGGYAVRVETARCEDYELIFRLYEAGFRGYNLARPVLDFYEDRASSKHSLQTRRNEYRVRKQGYRRLHVRGLRRCYAWKPLLLGLLPRRLYLRLRLGKTRKSDRDQPRP